MRLTVAVRPSELISAAALDLLFGDPPWLPHPIRGVGFLARHLERFWRWTRLPLRFAGCLFWITTSGICLAVVHWAGPRANTYWIYSFLACRDLDKQSSAVMTALDRHDLALARQRLAQIVGRDTADLAHQEVVRAAIETVAENTSDGVIAPLFYLALAGPMGMALYKVANTLDSTVGYRNTRYRDFGWWSARADDVLNLIPSRLTALLVAAAAPLVGCSGCGAWHAALRDGASQPSPNAGFPEAAFAGALGVQLGGTNYYEGVPSSKPKLGLPIRPLDGSAFRSARRLLYAASALSLTCILAAGRRRS
jgi:adenosylcobinamide-phosphate synthase